MTISASETPLWATILTAARHLQALLEARAETDSSFQWSLSDPDAYDGILVSTLFQFIAIHEEDMAKETQ